MAAEVFFTPDLTSASLLKLYEAVGLKLEGKVAVKLHSGEKGNQNFLKPDFFKPIIDKLDGTVVECNTAYDGERNTTAKHLKLLKDHGWSVYFKTDLMDEEGPDLKLEIKNGTVLKYDYVGKNIQNYDSMLVLAHFKGHPMGGFGGALKQLSIGCASSYGKAHIHSGGTDKNIWGTEQMTFITAMGESAAAVAEYLKGRAVYINVMKNLSVDCDCCAVAEDPCMGDIGMLASTDPVAVDKACLDLVYKSTDPGRGRLIERIESRMGALILDVAEAHGAGTKEYNLITL